MIATPTKHQKATHNAVTKAPQAVQMSTQDFVLLCPVASAAQAIHALYYLPAHYKLRVISDAHYPKDDITAFMDSGLMPERVEFATGPLQTNPSSYAHIVGNATDMPSNTDVPVIIISSTSGDGAVNLWPNSFTIPENNPEALASAALLAARATA